MEPLGQAGQAGHHLHLQGLEYKLNDCGLIMRTNQMERYTRASLEDGHHHATLPGLNNIEVVMRMVLRRRQRMMVMRRKMVRLRQRMIRTPPVQQ